MEMYSEATTISGLYEMVIGITDENESYQIDYWNRFGFQISCVGNLTAEAAQKLYGVKANLRSLRLCNQVTDRSLLRLMIWDTPLNQGLELSPLKVVGSRWGTSVSFDVLNIANHAQDAQDQGWPIYYVAPQRNLINRPENFQPFKQANPSIHEILLIQPLTRQVLFQRHDYHRPNSGIVNADSHFKASEFVHVGLIVDCDDNTLDFYEQVLGLVRLLDNYEGQDNPVTRLFLDIREDDQGHASEKVFYYYFTGPGYSSTEKNQIKSGSFEILRMEGKVKNKQEFSRPGCLGSCLYTLKVSDINLYHQKVKNSVATDVTQVTLNEFEEKSFSFVAPDGYYWTILENSQD